MLLKCSWYEYDMILIWSWYVHDMFMIVHDISGFSLFLLRCYWVGVTWCNLGITSALQGWRVCPGIPPSPGRGGEEISSWAFQQYVGERLLEDFQMALQVVKAMVFQPAEYVTSPGLGLAWDCLVVILCISYVILMILDVILWFAYFWIFIWISWYFHDHFMWFYCDFHVALSSTQDFIKMSFYICLAFIKPLVS